MPLSACFALLVAFRRLAYRLGWLSVERVPVPVIIVGNIAVGGSGKTPTVLAVVDWLQRAGWRPGILSRGYGGSLTGPAAVRATSLVSEVGDEPVLMAQRAGVPVWIGRDRVAVAKALLATHPEVDVLVSDDGLQHYRLGRDVELVVLDESVLGNGLPLPAGPLREPLSRLASAQLLLLHGPVSAGLAARLPAIPQAGLGLQAGRFYRLDDPSQTRSAADFAGLRLKALAGIGRPERFRETLLAMGLPLTTFEAFPDHHPYVSNDLALDGAEALLMTEKDAIKCAGLAPQETWVLPVDADVDLTSLESLLKPSHGSQTA
ncbi:tetraacyldisaccharide 4'-kinase [Viridibacterium curvum]|uniref:Tetraacyldisaccharide 4'-kinase n=1 Tax=Viridibacterium curvum TaxID=1101404 RepID=A0ABP9R2Z7_9RHOO